VLLLKNDGPTPRALLPSPLYQEQQGKNVRFEKLTRCTQEVPDGLLSLLFERLLMVPDLASDNAIFATPVLDWHRCASAAATTSAASRPYTVAPILACEILRVLDLLAAVKE
jgi:hypothetical protein